MLSTISHTADRNAGIGNGDSRKAQHKIRNWIANRGTRREMIDAGALLRVNGRWFIDDERFIRLLRKFAERTLDT